MLRHWGAMVPLGGANIGVLCSFLPYLLAQLPWFLKSNFFRLNLFPLKASPLASFFLSNEPLLLPFFFQIFFIYSRSREFAISP
jgi:hypothetical protein